MARPNIARRDSVVAHLVRTAGTKPQSLFEQLEQRIVLSDNVYVAAPALTNVALFNDAPFGVYGVEMDDFVVGDFNGDGFDDLAAVGTASYTDFQRGDDEGNYGDRRWVSVLLSDRGIGWHDPVTQRAWVSDDGEARIFAGDVDGDSDDDLIIASEVAQQYGSDSYDLLVQSFINEGDGSFQQGPVSSVETRGEAPGFARHVEIGEFTGDTNIDLIALYEQNYGSGDSLQLRVYSGDGLGGFDLANPIFSSVAGMNNGDGYGALAVGDLDNDGDMDAVVSYYYFRYLRGIYSDFVVEAFSNDGTGSFDSEGFLAGDLNQNRVNDLELADMNNDGLLDVVSANTFNNGSDHDGPIHVYLNETTTADDVQFGEYSGYGYGEFDNFAPGQIFAHDTDGDGNLDIVVDGAGLPVLRVFQGNGDGELVSQRLLAPLSGSIAGESSDLLSRSGNFYRNTDPAAAHTVVGDFNGDGETDLFQSETRFFFYDDRGGPADAAMPQVRMSVNVGGAWPAFEVYRQWPNPAESFHDGLEEFRTGDFDGDGLTDAVAFTQYYNRYPYSAAFQVLMNRGGWLEPIAFEGTKFYDIFELKVGDIDGDGDDDIVYHGSYYSGGEDADRGNRLVFGVQAWTQDDTPDADGDPTFTEQSSIRIAGDNGGQGFFNVNFHDLELGDMDGDGNTDVSLLTAAFNVEDPELTLSENTFITVFGDGTGGFIDHQRYSLDTFLAPFAVELGDLDNDGDLDAVIAHYADLGNEFRGGYYYAFTMITVLTNVTGEEPEPDTRGGNSVQFEELQTYLDGEVVNDIALGDIDGDGDLELVFGTTTVFAEYDKFNGGARGGDYDFFPPVARINVGEFATKGPTVLGLASWEPVFEEVFKEVNDIILGDVDGDSNLDIAASIGFSYYGRGPFPYFDLLPRDTTYQYFGTYFSETTVLRGDGEGSFGLAERYAFPFPGAQLSLGDYDGDADPDLWANFGFLNEIPRGGPLDSLPTTIFVTRNYGNGKFQEAVLPPALNPFGFGFPGPVLTGERFGSSAPTEFWDSEFADFDGDGLPDSALLQRVERDRLQGEEPEQYPVAVVEFRMGDGVWFEAPVYTDVLFNDSDEGEPGRGFPPPTDIQVVDLEGDGDLDLILGPGGTTDSASVTRGVSSPWFISLVNQGTGGFDFVSANAYTHEAYHSEFQVGDMNGDGNADIVAIRQGMYYQESDSIVILHGVGDGTFEEAAEIDPDTLRGVEVEYDFSTLALGDLDADGDTDIVVQSYATYHFGGEALLEEHDVDILAIANNGDGTYAEPVSVVDLDDMGVRRAPDIETGDFDGDGLADITATLEIEFFGGGFGPGDPDDFYQAIVIESLGAGSGGELEFSHAYDLRVPGALEVEVGDMDLDGDLDIVVNTTVLPPFIFRGGVYDASLQGVTTLFNNGEGFSEPDIEMIFETGSPFTSRVEHGYSGTLFGLQLDDVEGDGDLDIHAKALDFLRLARGKGGPDRPNDPAPSSFRDDLVILENRLLGFDDVTNQGPSLTMVEKFGPANVGFAFEFSYDELLAMSDAMDPDGDTIQFRVEEIADGTVLLNGVELMVGDLIGPGDTLTFTSDSEGTFVGFRVVAYDGQVASDTPVDVCFNVETGLPNELVFTIVDPYLDIPVGQQVVITYEDVLAMSDAFDPEGDTIMFRIDSLTDGTLLKNGVPYAVGSEFGPGDSFVWISDPNSPLALTEGFQLIATDGVNEAGPVPVNFGLIANPDYDNPGPFTGGEGVTPETSFGSVNVTVTNSSGEILLFQTPGDAEGEWTVIDLTTSEGVPPAIGDVEHYIDPRDGLVYIIAVELGDQDLLLIRQNADGTYQVRNLSDETGIGGVQPGFHFMQSPDGTNVYIAAVGVDGDVYLLNSDGTVGPDGFTFTAENLYDDPNGLAANGQDLPELSGRLSGFVTPWSAIHVMGLDTAGDIWSVWTAPTLTQYFADNLSEIGGTPTLEGQVEAVITPWGSMHVVGADADGNMVVTWWFLTFGGDWLIENLTEDFEGPAVDPASINAFVTPWGAMHFMGVQSEEGGALNYWWSPTLELEGKSWLVDPIADLVVGDEAILVTIAGVPSGLEEFRIGFTGTDDDGTVFFYEWDGPADSWFEVNLTETAVIV